MTDPAQRADTVKKEIYWNNYCYFNSFSDYLHGLVLKTEKKGEMPTVCRKRQFFGQKPTPSAVNTLPNNVVIHTPY